MKCAQKKLVINIYFLYSLCENDLTDKGDILIIILVLLVIHYLQTYVNLIKDSYLKKDVNLLKQSVL